jgi:hypothetical protein
MGHGTLSHFPITHLVLFLLTDPQNKSLSDSPDPVLTLQGIGWLTRKAIGLATVTQHLRQSPTTSSSGAPSTQIDVEQFATGGLKGSTEKRTLDWEFRGHSDWLFGTLEGRSRYNTLKGIVEDGDNKEDAKYLVEGWLTETEEGEVVESYVDNAGAKWTGWQIWGFAEIGEKRMLTRRFAIRKKDKDEVVRVRLVYDWQGELV